MKLGLFVGVILTTYGLYLLLIISKLVKLYSEFNANLPNNPYLFPSLVIIAGSLLILGYWFLRKRF